MKKVLSTLLLATLVLSVVAVAGVVPVRAATIGTLTASQTQFWGDAIVEIKLWDPDLDISSARDFAMVYIKFPNGTQNVLYLNESLPNSGEFYAYICANDTAGPQAAPYGQSFNVYGLSSNFSLYLSSGDTIQIIYNDVSPVGSTSLTLTYKEYKESASDIIFDRTSLKYPMHGYMKIGLRDLDLNKDPTVAESYTLNWSFYDPIKNETYYIVDTAKETGPNTAIFTITTSYWTGDTNIYGYTFPLQNVTSGSSIKVTLVNGSQNPYRYISFETFSRSISVAPSFTPRGDLVITVVDPNFDHKSWEAEKLTFTGTNVTLQTNKGLDNATLTSELVETDVASGMFKATVKVVWGDPANDNVIQLKVGDSKVDIYYYANGKLEVQGSSSLSTTLATITSDKTMYRAGSTVKLTLNAPDLNDDVNNLNYFECKLPGQNDTISGINVTYLNQKIGEISIKVNGLPAKGADNQTLVFVESDIDTGLYVASLDLTKIYSYFEKALTNGDKVTVSYYDSINKATTSVSFEIGIAAASIALDRSVYPVPLNGSVVFYVTVTDSEANLYSTLVDKSGMVYFDVYYYNGTKATAYCSNTAFDETDVNTGIFKGSFTLNQNDEKELINGWVKVRYIDPSTGDYISATATLRATDAMISVDKTSVKAGDILTITVRDPDWNFDSNKAESVTVYTDISGLPSLKLDETGKNTGVFTTELTIGDNIKVDPGTKMTFTYKDWSPSYVTASAGYPEEPVKYTATAKWITFTGTISIDKNAYGIGSTMTVTVVDPDLNKDIMSAESAEVTLRVEGIGDVKIPLSEDGANSDTFTGDFKWVAGSFSGTGWSGTDKDLIGKTFMVYYRDVADANGNTVYAMATGTIKSWDAIVAFNKLYYDLDEVAVISVTDPDANTNPGQIETVTITVVSDSDPLGQTITATETGANTGVFEGRIQISDSFATGKVFAKLGDTVTASYKDKYPADYAVTEKPKTFTGTAVVGVPIARPVPASDQKFVDPTTGAEKTAGAVGQTIMLQATVKNVDAKPRDFTAIFKVKDSAGVTIFIGWVTGTLAAGQELTPAVSWTPSAAGSYTVEVLVVKSLAEPTPYSDPLSMTLTVA